MKLILAGAVLLLSGCSFSLDGLRFYRAEMQISQRNYASALPLLQKIVEDSPDDDRALQAARKGARVAHFEAKAYQQAVNFYKFIILKSDDVVERRNAQKNIAQIYYNDLQDFDQSVTEFEKILKFDNEPDESFRYRLSLAKAYFRLNNAEQALNELDVLLAQKPDADKTFDILALKANVEVGNRKLVEAAQLWEKILKDFPERSKKEKVGLNLVVCYEELKQFDKAIEVLESMRPQYPNPDFLDLRISRLKERQYNQPGRARVEAMKNGIVFLGIGFELIALCIGGYVLGGFIDDYYGWKNTASTYMVLVLMIGWFTHLIYLLRRFEKDNAEDDSQSS